MSKTKILLILPNVEGGGTHKVVLNLASNLDREKFDITLLVVMNIGEFKNLVPSDIKTTFLGYDWLPKSFPGLLRTIRREMPDIILSATGHLNLMILSMRAVIGRNTRILVRESTNLSVLFEDEGYRWNPRIMKFLFSKLYATADSIVCQSDFMLEDLRQNFHIPLERLEKIHNPLDIDGIRDLALEEPSPYLNSGRGPHILSVGRLTYAKNFEALIDAFSKYQNNHPDARLWILGDGYLRTEIEQKTESLNLTKSVSMMGFQQNPFPWFRYADLFVLSSRYEGLPNVLLEALACDCPVLAADCPGGTREIMELTGNSGRLRPLDGFFIDESLVGKPNARGTLDALRLHFDVLRVTRQYEQIFLGLA